RSHRSRLRQHHRDGRVPHGVLGIRLQRGPRADRGRSGRAVPRTGVERRPRRGYGSLMSTVPNVRIGHAEALISAPARPAEITNRCALCANGTTRTLFQVDGTLIVKCGDCGLVRQDTRPLAAEAIYDGDYYATNNPKAGYANYFLDSNVNRRTFRDRIQPIDHPYGRRGRLLDVGCGLVRQDTRPLAAEAIYDGDYYATNNPKGGYANYFLDSNVNRRTFRDRIQAIEQRYGRRGRLLDVGCALGDFLLEAKASGWD